ncbi:MAG TPA: hypothetical protein VK745_22890 [Polyangiaceae bacterium]|nr:hypothetical protein [Polyangiaceae bacterium]
MLLRIAKRVDLSERGERLRVRAAHGLEAGSGIPLGFERGPEASERRSLAARFGCGRRASATHRDEQPSSASPAFCSHCYNGWAEDCVQNLIRPTGSGEHHDQGKNRDASAAPSAARAGEAWLLGVHSPGGVHALHGPVN